MGWSLKGPLRPLKGLQLTLKFVAANDLPPPPPPDHHHCHLRVTSPSVTLGYLEDGEGHFRVTIGNCRITIDHYLSFFMQT